jgi:hypothetical protein
VRGCFARGTAPLTGSRWPLPPAPPPPPCSYALNFNFNFNFNYNSNFKGNNTIVIRGTMPLDAQRFSFDICEKVGGNDYSDNYIIPWLVRTAVLLLLYY